MSSPAPEPVVWRSGQDADELELAAAEWLVLRPAGARDTAAAKLVRETLEAAYLRRRAEKAASS